MADPVTEDQLTELPYPLLPTDNILVGRGGLTYRADASKLFPNTGLTPPLVADFAATRNGAAGGWTNGTFGPVCTSTITSLNSNSLQWAVRTIVRGGTNSYRYTAKLRRDFPINRFSVTGLILRNSSSALATLIGICVDTVAGFNRNRYDNDTLFNAVSGVMSLTSTAAESGLMPDWWMKIEDDNTNRVTSFSMDGENWIQLQSEGNTTFVTPDQVGVVVNPNGFSSGGSVQGKIVHTTILSDKLESF